MIKKILITSCIILLSIQVHAQEIIFPDELLDEIRVVETNKEDGRAAISDGDGNTADVSLNDVISIDEATVIEIAAGHITVKRGNTKTRMLVLSGFE